MDPREALHAFQRMTDESDARAPHAVLVTDPQTDSRHVIGPYPSRVEAMVASLIIEARNNEVDPELANLTYEPVLWFDADPASPRGDT